MNDENLKVAQAIQAVIPDSRWIGTVLAHTYLHLLEKKFTKEEAARYLYDHDCYTLKKAREIVTTLKQNGVLSNVKLRENTGSAENPITKLFPGAITEQHFLEQIDQLRSKRSTVDYNDERESGHTLIDFTLTEEQLSLPINVKNAGTRFENAKKLVGLESDDCIPIPVYKAFSATEKEPNLIYAVAVDYSLIDSINKHLIPSFDTNETIVWNILNEYSGKRIRDAEDKFIYGMKTKHWDCIRHNCSNPKFRLISARKAIRILQKMPKRTPGVGLPGWGTGASAEVNVHISIEKETKSWEEVFNRIAKNGITDIIGAINRKKSEVVYDPEI